VNTSEKFGRSSPLGATLADSGVNFSLFSRSATGVELLFFDQEDQGQPERVICLDPVTNHTHHYWHVFVPGVEAGQIYGYRIQGPYEPSMGMRSDPAKVLLDPYGCCVVVPKNFSRELASRAGDNAATAMKSVVIDPRAYDWEDDRPLNRPSSRTIIYEMHLRGFTCHPSSEVSEKKRGTFAGLVEKIAYLKELGVSAVELLPVFQFDAQDCPSGLVNYWGYAPVSFFAPHRAYSSRQDLFGPGGRVPRHGQGVAPGWYRGHSRRCFQPYGGRWSRRTNLELPRSGQQHLLSSRRRPLALRQLQRHRETR